MLLCSWLASMLLSFSCDQDEENFYLVFVHFFWHTSCLLCVCFVHNGARIVSNSILSNSILSSSILSNSISFGSIKADVTHNRIESIYKRDFPIVNYDSLLLTTTHYIPHNDGHNWETDSYTTIPYLIQYCLIISCIDACMCFICMCVSYVCVHGINMALMAWHLFLCLNFLSPHSVSFSTFSLFPLIWTPQKLHNWLKNKL